MSDPIFVKTRYHYDSYSDFWKLVELSGFKTVYIDEIDFSEECLYILSPMNGEYRPFVDSKLGDNSRCRSSRKCVIYLWNLERPGSSGGVSNYRVSGDELVEQC